MEASIFNNQFHGQAPHILFSLNQKLTQMNSRKETDEDEISFNPFKSLP
jgi:hypothetical protein